MKQDFSGFMDCMRSVSVSDVAGGNACMVSHGYDPNTLSVEQALILARSQLDDDIEHHQPTAGEHAGVIAFLLFLLLVASLIILGFRSIIRSAITQRRQWRELPTLESYLMKHPDCRTGAGIKCSFCGSKSLKNWGLSSAQDSLRSFICNSCGKTLYRQGE